MQQEGCGLGFMPAWPPSSKLGKVQNVLFPSLQKRAGDLLDHLCGLQGFFLVFLMAGGCGVNA